MSKQLIDNVVRGYSDAERQPSDRELLDEQLALEKRAAELVPFLSEKESETLKRVTLHHYVITQMRTSKVPYEMGVTQLNLPKDLLAQAPRKPQGKT